MKTVSEDFRGRIAVLHQCSISEMAGLLLVSQKSVLCIMTTVCTVVVVMLMLKGSIIDPKQCCVHLKK